MRIAIFAETYFPFISGVVTHIKTLKEGLEAEGHKVLIVTLDPKARVHYVRNGILYCPAVPLKRIYGYGVANPVNLRRLKILKEFDPDIIHLHTEFSMGIFALFAARRLKKPVVYTLHTMYDDYIYYLFPEKMNKMAGMAKPAAHAYIRKVASKSTQIIGPSVKVVDYLKRCGVEKYINIVPNTVDLSDFMPSNISKQDTDAAKKVLGINTGDISIIFVGRLGKEKSIDVLIDYFTKGFKGQKQFRLFIIGDGPEREPLNQLVKDLGMQDQIKLTGRIDHNLLPGYYNACDLFSTASVTEMNSISLLEANASGLYAVHILDIYNKDQIHTGENGEIYTNAEEFKDIMQRYADLSPEEKQEMKKRVNAYACRYGLPEFTAKILNVYERAVDQYYD